jgi:hypothetical protein
LDPGAKDQVTIELPTAGTRAVSNSGSATIDGETGTIFTVTEIFNNTRTSMNYFVVPYGASGSTVAQQTNETPAAGLYLRSMTSSDLDGNNATSFTPSSPVELMPFPTNTNVNTTFESAGTDAQQDKAMVLPPSPGSMITGEAHVDACGLLLDSWEVHINGYLDQPLLTAGQPTNNCPYGAACSACPAGAGNPGFPGCTPFTLILDIGTQFGGISLQDHLTEDGFDTKLNKPFTYDVTATIDQEPAG